MFPITLFFYGFMAACAGLILQILPLLLWGQEATVTAPGIGFVFVAALAEELAKLVFLIQAFRRYSTSALSFSSLIFFGLGFATLELIFAFFLNPDDLPPLLLVTLNVVLHVGTTLLLGFTLRRFFASRLFMVTALLLITLLHTLYNLYRLQA